jgi:hypothetical protein
MIEVLTALLVIITGIYAWATYKILRANENVVGEMQRQSEEIARPRISIFAHTLPSRPMIHLTLRNIGPSSASNLRLRLSKPFYVETRNEDLAATTAFSKPIPNFGPGERMDFQLGRTFVILGENRDEKLRPLEFSIESDYWFGSRHYTETTQIDLGVLAMAALTTDAIVEQMTYLNNHLKEIRRELHDVANKIPDSRPDGGGAR